ncbi:MAG TPA: glycosyltransferase family 9 protein, partial [Chlamydiales bacterium]|nr:glycosyltransferase family 9 protein [Chlamydiales bacterium]
MKRFAIVKISALGDVVQSFGVATYIRNLYPDCEIDWFADAPSIELAANHPAISNAQFFNFNHWKKQKDYKGFYSFLKKIRSKHYDYVFDLQGNLKSSILTFCLKASQKVGFGKKSVREWPNLLVTDLKFDFPKFMNKRLQYLNLVSLALENKSYETISNIEPKRSNKIAKKALIMVGSRWKAKQLSFDDWLYIVDLLINQYHLDI